MVKTIQSRLLRESVSVQTFLGTGAYGPGYDTAATVACRAESLRQLVRNMDGVEVVSELTLYVLPTDAAKFTTGSLVTYGGVDCTVIRATPQGRPGEIVLTEVVCT